MDHRVKLIGRASQEVEIGDNVGSETIPGQRKAKAIEIGQQLIGPLRRKDLQQAGIDASVWRDGLVLAALLWLAAVLRLVALPRRGEWGEDQGDELLALLHWVRDGQFPLLGPVSSIHTVHHGIAIYWLLAPSAFLTDTDPVAAAATLALIGVAGVGGTWWLGRTVGGPLAGHVAGLLMAVSPSAIGASTFVWNSNIVGPAAALALAASWYAWRTRRARWWLAAALGLLLMLQGHLLTVIAVPAFFGLLVADVLRRCGGERRRMLGPVLGVAAILAAGYAPVLVYEVANGFAETRAIVGYAAAGLPGAPRIFGRLPVVTWRVLAWPVSGFARSAALLGLPAAVITTAALVFGPIGGTGINRQFGRWAAATTMWTVMALSLISPSLAVIDAGVPNDQYHGWLDPVLLAAVGVAVARMCATAQRLTPRVVAVVAVAACVGLSVASMPPLSSPDGGWPRAAAAALRIGSVAGDRPIAVTGVAETGGELEFPLRRRHLPIGDLRSAQVLVVVCDPYFERAIGLPCGGWAELSRARQAGFPAARLVDRFTDSPRRVVCLFTRD